jgi:hypothetical protein
MRGDLRKMKKLTLSELDAISMRLDAPMIKEIKPKECEHEPHGELLRRATWVDYGKTIIAPCAHCGIKLKAKWEAE